MRFNELIAGTRSDVAVKIFGPDFEILKHKADAVARIIEAIPGSADVKVEPVAGLSTLRIVVDREQVARYGLTAEDVLAVVQTLRVGRVVGTLFQETRRFDIVVQVKETVAADRTHWDHFSFPRPMVN